MTFHQNFRMALFLVATYTVNTCLYCHHVVSTLRQKRLKVPAPLTVKSPSLTRWKRGTPKKPDTAETLPSHGHRGNLLVEKYLAVCSG